MFTPRFDIVITIKQFPTTLFLTSKSGMKSVNGNSIYESSTTKNSLKSYIRFSLIEVIGSTSPVTAIIISACIITLKIPSTGLSF